MNHHDIRARLSNIIIRPNLVRNREKTWYDKIMNDHSMMLAYMGQIHPEFIKIYNWSTSVSILDHNRHL